MSDILRVGILTPVELFDPRSAFDFANNLVYWHLYQTPYRPSASAAAATEPVLFEAPLEARSDDLRTWAGQLRRGLRFSNGAPLDAETLADSLRRSRVCRNEAKVEVDGDWLVFELHRPHSRFDCMLCHQTCAAVLEHGGRWLGSGPYMVVENRDSHLTLTRNPYFEPAPAIPDIELSVHKTDEDGRPRALIAAIERGEVDFTLALSRDDLHEIKGVHKWMGQGDATAYLYFNTERPAFADRRLRQALSQAVDRRALAAASYASPLAFAASGFLPPSMALMPDGVRADPEQAGRLLDDLGRPPGPLSMLVVPVARPHLPHPATTARLLVEQFAAVGVEVVPAPTRDIGDYMDRVVAGDYDLALSGWIPDTPDLATLFEVVLGSSGVPDSDEAALVAANLARWRHAPMDEALEAYRRDPISRHLNTIGELLSLERPLLPLLYGSQIVIHAWRVKDRPAAYHNRPFFTEMRL